MKKLFYLPLLIMLLGCLIAGFLSLGQPATVYAAAPVDLNLLPDGAGDYTNIDVLTGAATHWEAVDDPVGVSDDLTTMVGTASTTQLKDAFTLQYTALLTGSLINSVTVYFRVAGSAGGTKTHYYQPFLRLSPTEQPGTEIAHSTNTFTTYSEVLTRPGGGSWTWTDIDNLQVAIGLRDGGVAGNPQCTQVYVVVNYTPSDILNLPTDFDFQMLGAGDTANTGINCFTLENLSGFNVDVTIEGTDLTGGDATWVLADTAGSDIYGLRAGLDDDYDLYDIIVKKTTPDYLIQGLAPSGTQGWGLEIYMPTPISDTEHSMSGIVTLIAYASS